VLVFVWFVLRRRWGGRCGGRGNSARAILRERYARGEIGVDEYRERLGTLEER
jgi:uncharacterized membrane protein